MSPLVVLSSLLVITASQATVVYHLPETPVYPPPRDDGGVDVLPFIEITKHAIIPIFDKLGPTAFSPIKSDMNGNIAKIGDYYYKNGASLATLRELLQDEIQAGMLHKSVSPSMGLLWLYRTQRFVSVLLNGVMRGEESMKTVVSDAYSRSLKEHHGWIARGVFALAMNAVPHRDTFLDALRGDTGLTDSQILSEMKIFVSSLDASLDVIEKLLDELQIEEKMGYS